MKGNIKMLYQLPRTVNQLGLGKIRTELLVQKTCNCRVELNGTVYVSIALKLLLVNYEIWRTPVSVPTDIQIIHTDLFQYFLIRHSTKYVKRTNVLMIE